MSMRLKSVGRVPMGGAGLGAGLGIQQSGCTGEAQFVRDIRGCYYIGG